MNVMTRITVLLTLISTQVTIIYVTNTVTDSNELIKYMEIRHECQQN